MPEKYYSPSQRSKALGRGCCITSRTVAVPVALSHVGVITGGIVQGHARTNVRRNILTVTLVGNDVSGEDTSGVALAQFVVRD